MAYVLNSKKDSRGDEHLYVADFNKNLPAIQAYKVRHGGDWEHAYQAVTGKPWPAGRSVKVKHGVGEMTADRTFKSVALKYVAAPAAVAATAAFAPGAFPAIGHALGFGGGSGIPTLGNVNATMDALIAGGGGGGGGGGGAAGGLSAWLKPVLQYGVPAATNLIGSHMQGNAERDAAQTQVDYLNRALDVEKENEQYRRQQYADYLGRLKPYNEAGTAAVTRASGLLSSGGEIGRTVRLQAPDGSISDVNEALVDHYISRGARRV